MSEHHVILGDGVAGATCATTLRKHSDDAKITVITREPEPLYNRVKIKEFAKGTVEEAKVMIHDLETYAKNDIEILLETEAKRVHDERNEIELMDGSTIKYDKLCIALGGTPRRLGLEGGDAEGIHTFWTLRDARQIREDAQQADNGVAVGAGLLGIDLAVVFAKNHVDTKYVMRGNRWWREGLSKEGSEIVERGLADMGVECVFFETPKRFHVDGDNHIKGLETESGKVFKADIAGVAVGLNFNTNCIADSNVKTGEGILTDSYLRTSVPNVWAAGDITQYYDVVQDRINMNGSWISARAQGETAALNMLGQEVEFRHVDVYNVNHFPFMIGSVGSIYGDADAERIYDEQTYRRLIFKQGRLNGVVLLGNIKVQNPLKKIIGSKLECQHYAEQLLEEAPDIDGILKELEAEQGKQEATATT